MRRPGTGVLRSRLGLGAAAALEAAEREITRAALVLLRRAPVRAACDLARLCGVHRRVFGGICDWAGQVRTVAIAKGGMFCLPQFIGQAMARISGQLRDEGLLRDLGRDAFIDRLACYLGEVSAVRSFREGNGRARRAFSGQLAAGAGYVLDWQELDAERNIAVSGAIVRGDPGPMRRMLDELIRDR